MKRSYRQKHLPDYKFREKGLSQGERMWMQLGKFKDIGIANAKRAHSTFEHPEHAFEQSVTTVFQMVELLIANSIR